MTQPTQSTQEVQIGVEGGEGGGYGIGVECNTRLLSLGFDIKPEQTYDTFTPMGYKFPTVVTLIEDWSSGTIDGRMSYDELIYGLASAVCSPTSAIAGTGTEADSTTWTFTPDFEDIDTPLSYTIQMGNDVIAEQVVGALISELGFTIDRSAGATVNGAVLAQSFSVPITRTAAPTSITPEIITSNNFDLFLDDVFSHVNTGDSVQLLDCRIGDFKITNRWGPFWAINSSLPSFSDYVELLPVVTFTLTMSADSVGWGVLADARVGDTVYITLSAIGPIVTGCTTTHNKFRLTMCGKVNAVPAKGYNENVIELTWQFSSVFDPTANYAFTAVVTNGLPTNTLAPAALLS